MHMGWESLVLLGILLCTSIFSGSRGPLVSATLSPSSYRFSSLSRAGTDFHNSVNSKYLREHARNRPHRDQHHSIEKDQLSDYQIVADATNSQGLDNNVWKKILRRFTDNEIIELWKDFKEIKGEILPALQTAGRRLPMAVTKAAVLSCKSFVTTSLMLFPVGLALNVMMIKNEGVRPWLNKATQFGFEFGTYNAVFTGFEGIFFGVREAADSWNTYLASGCTTTFLHWRDPKNNSRNFLGYLQAFASGFGLLYFFDKFSAYNSQQVVSEEVKKA